MTSIANKAALVTGGGSGIGRGLALGLAQAGARVVIADLMLENAQKVADEITALGGEAVALQCDVCERAAVHDLKARANAAVGPIDLLFANAGATSFDKFLDMEDNHIDWIYQVNLMGVTYCLQAFLPDMVAKRSGHVVATASMAGLLPAWIADHGPYSAAKLGVIGLMLNLRMELEQYGVGSTVYCPGGVATGMKDNNEKYRPDRFGGPGEGPVHVPAEHLAKVKAIFLSPEQIAPMVLRGVEHNRAIVVDHSNQRHLFYDTYAKYVDEAFDDVAAFETEFGLV